MNVSLTPELEKFIDGRVESGLYNNASEVIRAGLRLLKEQEDLPLRLREQIEAGWLHHKANRLDDGANRMSAATTRLQSRQKRRA